MATDISDEKMQELADYLQGSSETLAHGLSICEIETTSDEDDIKRVLEEDYDIYLCPECGWWVEGIEREEGPDGEDICTECFEKHQEVEDEEDDDEEDDNDYDDGEDDVDEKSDDDD